MNDYFLVVLGLIVSTSAVDCLASFICKVTYVCVERDDIVMFAAYVELKCLVIDYCCGFKCWAIFLLFSKLNANHLMLLLGCHREYFRTV